ncbi:hypothetical protein DFJ77DRAFT_40240 [Powellomyces hirtus]|nr:hypothetical protein DFJ77DRAFT_40240 [Powellomyces hirtus]
MTVIKSAVAGLALPVASLQAKLTSSTTTTTDIWSRPTLDTLPKPVLAQLLELLPCPQTFTRTCRRVHQFSQDEHVRARWILARCKHSAVPPASPLSAAQALALVRMGIKARVLNLSVIAVLDRWIARLDSVESVKRSVGKAWDGWKEMDVAIARLGDVGVAKWCARRALVTDWNKAIEVAVGVGNMDVAVALLASWADNVAVASTTTNPTAEPAPQPEMKRSSSQDTIIPGGASQPSRLPPPPHTETPASAPASIKPHPTLLTHLLTTDNLPLFLSLLPYLPHPLPPTTLPHLLSTNSSPRILSHVLTHNLVPLDSLLLSLAQAPATTRAQTLKSLTMHAEAIEGRIRECEAAGTLLNRAALEGDVDTCAWLVQAGVPVSGRAFSNAKDAGEKMVLKVLKKDHIVRR